MKKKIRPKKSLKVLFCGSFKFLDEMNELAQKLRDSGFECFLSRFALGSFSSRRIERMKEKRKRNGLKDGEFEKVVEVVDWFYKN